MRGAGARGECAKIWKTEILWIFLDLLLLVTCQSSYTKSNTSIPKFNRKVSHFKSVAKKTAGRVVGKLYYRPDAACFQNWLPGFTRQLLTYVFHFCCEAREALDPHQSSEDPVTSLSHLSSVVPQCPTANPVVISQTISWVSQVRLATVAHIYIFIEWTVLPPIPRWFKFTAGVSHHTPPPSGGGWPQPINYILNIFILNYYIH